jgi:hypothetical protein
LQKSRLLARAAWEVDMKKLIAELEMLGQKKRDSKKVKDSKNRKKSSSSSEEKHESRVASKHKRLRLKLLRLLERGKWMDAMLIELRTLNICI